MPLWVDDLILQQHFTQAKNTTQAAQRKNRWAITENNLSLVAFNSWSFRGCFGKSSSARRNSNWLMTCLAKTFKAFN